MRIGSFSATSPSVFETDDDPVMVGAEEIEKLIEAARAAPNGRARLLLHTDQGDSLHEMVIALPASSCDHPHINFKSGKSFLALSGQFAVMRFSDDGETVKAIVLSDGKRPGGRLIRIRGAAWHTIIPLAGETVFLEVIIGPFQGNRFAPWFPDETQPEAREEFIERLRKIAKEAATAID